MPSNISTVLVYSIGNTSSSITRAGSKSPYKEGVPSQVDVGHSTKDKPALKHGCSVRVSTRSQLWGHMRGFVLSGYGSGRKYTHGSEWTCKWLVRNTSTNYVPPLAAPLFPEYTSGRALAERQRKPTPPATPQVKVEVVGGDDLAIGSAATPTGSKKKKKKRKSVGAGGGGQEDRGGAPASTTKKSRTKSRLNA